MVNYSQGKIYRIVPNCEHEPHEQYIGSTSKEYLSQRMVEHRKHYKSYTVGKRGLTTSFILFDKYGIDNCSIILIELVNANSRDELLKREREHMETNACVNKFMPARTNEERLKYNKEYLKKHRQENREKYLVYSQNHYRNNKEEEDKKRAARQIERYKTSPVVQCACGSTYKECNTWAHLKCKRHLEYNNK